MFLRILIITSLCSLTSQGVWAVYNQYPFHNQQDLIAPADQFPGWSDTLTRQHHQQSALMACSSNPKACPGRLKSFHRMLKKSESLHPDEKLTLVNFYINRSRYRDDDVIRLYDKHGKKVGSQRSQWSTLYEFLTRGGDCEDFATAKYFMLRQMGFDAQALRVVVVFDRSLRGHHAVLAVSRPDGAIWLLDSDNKIRKKSHRGYRYIYAMNELQVWDHREDYVRPNSTTRR